MGENQTTLFHTVFSRLIESLTPHVKIVFMNYFSFLEDPSNTLTQDELFDLVFFTFPRQLPAYSSTISTLLKVIDCNPSLLLNDLSIIFKKLMKTKSCLILTYIQEIYIDCQECHSDFYFSFCLIFISDLICQALVKYGTSNSTSVLIKCAYRLCSFKIPTKSVYQLVFRQWSVILSILSEKNFQEIVKQFDSLLLSENSDSALLLLRYMRLDLNNAYARDFLDEVSELVKGMLRKKQLTETILNSISDLVKTAPMSDCEAPLKSFFEVAWSVKENKLLKNGAYFVIAALFPKLPEFCNKIEFFYKNHVFSKTANIKKVEQSIKLFLIDLFGTNFDPRVLFWEWGVCTRTPPLSFLRWGGKHNISNPLGKFMEHFFAKADFSVCPRLFNDMLLFFASSNFDEFVDMIVPQFLTLDSNDNRFIALLMTVPLINSNDFCALSINKISPEKIANFNSKLKPKILESFLAIQTDDEKQAISIMDNDTTFEHLVEESDQYICDILKTWKLTDFNEVNIQHMKSEKNLQVFSLEFQLLRVVPIILPPEDMFVEQTMLTMLKLSFSFNQAIANEALSICSTLVLDSRFVSMVVEFLMTPPSAEALFICISMLYNCFKKRPSFPKNLIYDVELVAMIGLTSYHPATRHVAYNLLIIINDVLNQKGLFSFLHGRSILIQKFVKKRLFRHSISDKPQVQTILPAGEIQAKVALLSHYFDIWKVFLAECANVIVRINYEPMIERSRNKLGKYLGSQSAIIYSSIFASYFSIDLLAVIHQPYPGPLYKEYQPQNDADSRATVSKIMNNILTGENPELAFSIILHTHVTLFPTLIDLLSSTPIAVINEAALTVAIAIRHPSISPNFMRLLMPYVVNFCALLQGYIIANKINGPRVIRWKKELENIVIINKELARNYCVIISQLFSRINDTITEEDWPLSTREIVFRFLVNWSMTTSNELESLREYAAAALADIVHVGPLFSDSLLFDGSSFELFSQFELDGSSILGPLLYNHVDLLMENYIEACYVEPRNSADFFFEAFFTAFDASRESDIRLLTGPLLLLGLVYNLMNHPRAEAFIDALIRIISHKEPHFKPKFMHQSFAAATESVIDSALSVLSLKNLHVPPKDIIESVRPWISNLRLLPKQQNCVSGIPPEFEKFTPYQFLESLMETTEIIDDDNFGAFVSLWTELMKCPDHSELVPLFISQWRNPDTKRRVLMQLIKTDAPNIVKGLALHCSFAYYFHVTSSLAKEFDSELWVVPLITEAFKVESEELVQHIPTVVHFAFLFNDCGARELLEVLCQQFSINLPEDLSSSELISPVVAEFAVKLQQNSEEYLDYWGAEALKWLFGCQSLKIAQISLTIFNQILRPIEPLVVTGICKAVTFHVVNSSNDTKRITELVAQAFTFYSTCFEQNELFAFQFACAFLDCKIFVDSCLKGAAKLFMKSLSSKQTNALAWQVIIGVVRPLLAKLEKDRVSQQILELLINTSQNQELMMIVAPIKIIMPQLFPLLMIFDDLMEAASETVLCKALVHYATMIETASTQLLNAIFNVSTLIVRKVVNENNRTSLAKIYKAALNNLSNCEYAIEFVTIIAKSEPCVATKSVYEFYDWNRSIEDVVRSLGRIIEFDDMVSPITDCGTLQSVYNLLNCDTVPKILPFAAQQEMIEGMMRVTKALGKKRQLSVRRSSHGARDSMIVSSRSANQLNDQNEISWEYEPLWKPDKIFVNSNEFEADWKSGMLMSPMEFAIKDSSN